MTTLSDEQFQMLLGKLLEKSEVKTETSQATKNDPAALGLIKPCLLGNNKIMKLTKFEKWLEEAENRMEFMGCSDDKSKINLVKVWGGTEILDFLKAQKIEIDTANPNYPNFTCKIKDELRKLVNRTMAMHDLLTTKQGSKKWMDYIDELNNKAKILDIEKNPYTSDDVVKDAAIFGMSDARLRERALAEDPNLAKLISLGQAKEAGKADAQTLRESNTTVKKIDYGKESHGGMSPDEIDTIIEDLKVMKLKKVGKYSSRAVRSNDSEECKRCITQHIQGRCPANGKSCFTCGERNHFSRAPICKGTREKKSPDDDTKIKDYLETRTGSDSRKKGISSTRQIIDIRMLAEPASHLWVNVTIGSEDIDLYIDSGCDVTIVPANMYQEGMGHIQSCDTKLRAWGSPDLLDVIGVIKNTITTQKGAKRDTNFHSEPLLGIHDA